PRLILMALLATVWGVRLTYNFSRHGGYTWKFWTGHEDYRWAHVRLKPELQGKARWTVFHLFFICGYQNALLLLLALPSLVVQSSARPLYWADYVLAAIFVALVVIETVADQQQWNFQAAKKSGEAKQGFISTGLFSLARHPNYAAEQSIWIVFFLFSV